MEKWVLNGILVYTVTSTVFTNEKRWKGGGGGEKETAAGRQTE